MKINLLEQAEKAVENGEYDKAEQLFNQARDESLKEVNKRLVSAAELTAFNGQLQLVQLNYKEAGKYYEKAAKLLPDGNDEILAGYLDKAKMAFSH